MSYRETAESDGEQKKRFFESDQVTILILASVICFTLAVLFHSPGCVEAGTIKCNHHHNNKTKVTE